MRKTLGVLVIAVMGFGGLVTAQDQPITEEQVQRAHKDLQEALATIRSYHLAHHPGDARFPHGLDRSELMASVGKPRMGILVESRLSDNGEFIGAEIKAVTPGGPAAEAGLEAGDVLTRVDGVELADGHGPPHDVLIRQLLRYHEGDALAVEYSRDGDQRSTTVSLRALEVDEFVLQKDLQGVFEPGARFLDHDSKPLAGWYFPHGWMDMELVSLNPELGEYFGSVEGVLVVRGPNNDELGLEGGDVIVSIDNRVVASPTHAMRILRSYEPEETMDIEIIRRGHHEVITASVPEHRVRILDEWTVRE